MMTIVQVRSKAGFFILGEEEIIYIEKERWQVLSSVKKWRKMFFCLVTRQKKNVSPNEEMNLRPSKPQRPYGE